MAEQLDTADYKSMSTEQLLQLEKEYAAKVAMLNSMQMAFKIVLNSLYGALGNSSFRYFNISLASSVTTSGQLSIRWIERKLNEWMDKKTGISKDRVVLIDTDSVVLDLEDVVNKFCPPDKSREEKLEFLNQLGKKVIDPYIDQSYKELAEYVNAFEQRMHMKRENIIDSMVSVAAKSYVMAVFDSEGVRYTLKDPYMKIMGVQLVKSSTPKVIQQALRDSLPILLHQNEKDMQKYIADVKNRYNDFTIEQIAFPRGITNLANFEKKNFAKIADKESDPNKRQVMLSKLNSGSDLYIKGTPIHVRGSLIYNNLISKLGLTQSRKKIVDGDKIKFVYLKTPNPIHEDCIAFQDNWPTEFNLDQYVDYDKMFEKTFLSMIEKMIAPLNWKTQQQSYLEDFFVF